MLHLCNFVLPLTQQQQRKMEYKNWIIEEAKDVNEIVWIVRHQSSQVPYSLYDMTIVEVKEWIDEQNDLEEEFKID